MRKKHQRKHRFHVYSLLMHNETKIGSGLCRHLFPPRLRSFFLEENIEVYCIMGPVQIIYSLPERGGMNKFCIIERERVGGGGGMGGERKIGCFRRVLWSDPL